MSIGRTLQSEFAHEATLTRQILQTVPESLLSWKPCSESLSLARLAGHVAALPNRVGPIMGRRELDLESASFHAPFRPQSMRDLLVEFGSSVGDFNSTVLGASDSDFKAVWTLRSGERILAFMPRSEVLRQYVFDPLRHSRDRLTGYLRMLDTPFHGSPKRSFQPAHRVPICV